MKRVSMPDISNRASRAENKTTKPKNQKQKKKKGERERESEHGGTLELTCELQTQPGITNDCMAGATCLADQTCSFPGDKGSGEAHDVASTLRWENVLAAPSLWYDSLLHSGLESEIHSEDLLPSTEDHTCRPHPHSGLHWNQERGQPDRYPAAAGDHIGVQWQGEEI